MDAIRILLVDDQQVIREGLRRMLEIEPDLKVVGEAADAKEALAQVESLSPEVILMDIKMPGANGIELTRQVKQKRPSCNVIMLTLYSEYLPQAIEAGASGNLVNDNRRDELLRAIRAIREGHSPISIFPSQDQLAELVTPAENRQSAHLSERELSILSLIANGVTSKEMANQLFLSEATVKRSVRLILDKLGVRNRSEAVAEAYKRKLI
jgi:DNA-binding NarL/FixJ family response regulator